MFKKYLVLASLLAFGASSAFCAVPIFNSTSAAEMESQQINIAPVSSGYSAGSGFEENIKPQNNFQELGQIQNDNFKNAIQSLDGAQVGIREQLVDYKLKYNDAKTRYDASKTECDILKKQIKTHEKRMKDIERTKKNISKTMGE